MITLPGKNTDKGAVTRLLLAECRGPSFPNYNLLFATECMQLMVLVLWNRTKDPAIFLAAGSTITAVIRAPGQFQGFQSYPTYDQAIMSNIEQMLTIANNPKDRRSTDFKMFIDTAMAVAGAPAINDPSPGRLTGWRTGGSSSPGRDFIFFKTVNTTDFYYMHKKQVRRGEAG